MESFASVDHVQHWILKELLRSGVETAPRGMRTRELESVQFRLENPRARRLGNRARRWSFAAAVGEFAWHTSGERDLNPLLYYLPRWAELSDDPSEVRGSCYGWRVFRRSRGAGSQWDRLVRLLQADPESRRAVLTLHTPTLLLDPQPKDAPCALAVQFFIRGGALNALTTMRSNDAIWGVPYDVFLFTMWQELLAAELGVEVGTYTHVAGSMHLYERHFALANRILEGPLEVADPMPALERPEQLALFLQHEAWLRNPTADRPDVSALAPYWRGLLNVLEGFAADRHPPLIPAGA